MASQVGSPLDPGNAIENLRTYGQPPFGVAVIHGGPGAAGQVTPVARELACDMGVLEPLQTRRSVGEQVEELKTVLKANADIPVTLVGFSWGAWLSYLCAAYHPHLVSKLILVSSAPFEEKYAAGILQTRLSRLGQAERRLVESMMETMKAPDVPDKNELLARFGRLFTKADAYDPLTLDCHELDASWDIHQSVWSEAAHLRSSGRLLELGKQIECPVVALHGDYDPHPADGVRKPLEAVLKDFRFILLRECGHTPWIESRARDSFYEILRGHLYSRR